MTPLLFLVLSQATGRPVHPTHKPVTIDDAPVTAREARASFARAAALLFKVNGRLLGTPSIPDADRAATRGEIVAEMDRFYNQAEPTFRITPASVPFDPAKFRIDVSQRTALGKMVGCGCIARIGPLAVGPSNGLTPKEFGDALGFFMARIGQMSHLPDSQWTPMLKAD